MDVLAMRRAFGRRMSSTARLLIEAHHHIQLSRTVGYPTTIQWRSICWRTNCPFIITFSGHIASLDATYGLWAFVSNKKVWVFWRKMALMVHNWIRRFLLGDVMGIVGFSGKVLLENVIIDIHSRLNVPRKRGITVARRWTTFRVAPELFWV